MRIVSIKDIYKDDVFSTSPAYKAILSEIKQGISAVRWPKGSDGFYLDPNSTGRGRGEGNGVKPIKVNFVDYLTKNGWLSEMRVEGSKTMYRGPLDIAKKTKFGIFGVEWETGNISSSHRALNKICLGVLTGEIIGGILILPSRKLYKHLTDRIGNAQEIEPYIPLWENIKFSKGVISIVVIEYDGLVEGTPRIPKGTDGRALL